MIARIAAWESAAAREEHYNYYVLWLGALEDVLVDLCAVSTHEVTARAEALAQRPAGHDHRHDQERIRTYTVTERAVGVPQSPLLSDAEPPTR